MVTVDPVSTSRVASGLSIRPLHIKKFPSSRVKFFLPAKWLGWLLDKASQVSYLGTGKAFVEATSVLAAFHGLRSDS